MNVQNIRSMGTFSTDLMLFAVQATAAENAYCSRIKQRMHVLFYQCNITRDILGIAFHAHESAYLTCNSYILRVICRHRLVVLDVHAECNECRDTGVSLLP
jgi:hypothetical protein